MIEEIEIPKGVTRISSLSFSGCIGLRKIIIPETVTVIYQNAFNKCDNIEIIFKGAVPSGTPWGATNVTITTE